MTCSRPPVPDVNTSDNGRLDEVVIDSFWISVLTAILLAAMIAVLARFEHGIHRYFFEQHSWRVAGILVIWLVLFGSKFLILEVVDLVFGEHVALGHLLEVILIVVSMMVSGQLMQAIYDRLGSGLIHDPDPRDDGRDSASRPR